MAALDEGADDYITKPFSIQELLARVRVQSRRMVASEVQASLIELGDFRIDVERHQVLVRDVEVHLTPKEFDLMLYFVRNADRVLTHKVLLRAVWGAAGADQPEYLRVLVAQLRKKIEPDAGRARAAVYPQRTVGGLPAEPAARQLPTRPARTKTIRQPRNLYKILTRFLRHSYAVAVATHIYGILPRWNR